jgi:hypothetical protein
MAPLLDAASSPCPPFSAFDYYCRYAPPKRRYFTPPCCHDAAAAPRLPRRHTPCCHLSLALR